MGSPFQEAQSRVKPAHGKVLHRLLLVEEDAGDLSHYFGILRTLGYRVVVAKSYTHALALLEGEQFDLVMVGQGSPSFDGRLVVIRSLELNPHVPVVVVARSLDIDCYLEAMELGVADYVERGTTPRDFMRAMDFHLQIEPAA
jgi:DNA-binding NtrC family response regulator